MRFTDSQINELRESYDEIEKMDPTSDAGRQLLGILNAADDELLVQLKRSKIKFLSTLAFSHMIRRSIPDLDAVES